MFVLFSYFNGNYSENINIPLDDRSYRFGDGIFDKIIFHKKKFFNFDFHLSRIKYGLKVLKIKCNLTNLDSIFYKLLDLNEKESGFIKILISRSGPSSGYSPTTNNGNIFVTTEDLGVSKNRNFKLTIAKYKKIPVECLPINLKLNNSLNSVLNIIEAKEKNFDEAIILNMYDIVTECCSANIFFISSNKIYTPSESCGIFPGSIRDFIINKSGFEITQGKFSIDDLKNADTIFLTNTGYLTMPVSEIQGKKLDYNSKLYIEISKNVKNTIFF